MNLVLQGEGVIKESIIERGAINNASLDQNLLCLSMWSVIQIFGLCSVFFSKMVMLSNQFESNTTRTLHPPNI